MLSLKGNDVGLIILFNILMMFMMKAVKISMLNRNLRNMFDDALEIEVLDLKRHVDQMIWP